MRHGGKVLKVTGRRGRIVALLLAFVILAGCQQTGGNGPVTTATTAPGQQTNPASAPASTPAAQAPAATPSSPARTATPTTQTAATAPPSATGTVTAPAQAPSSGQASLDDVSLVVERAVEGLQAPVFLTHAGDGSGRQFVLEKAGRIRIVRDGALLPEPFLDITDLVGSRGNEQGLLGLAFHPRYEENGQFYVNYTDDNGDTVIARYTVQAGNPDRAERASAHFILTLGQPHANHNGGMLLFGPDGYLWIGTGDGGAAGDPQENAQNGQSLLGKMLRIDVDRGERYAIPEDNPYLDDPQVRDEIWAIGLRNPWRYSFDRETKDLYIADVGQNRYEEVNFTPAGHAGGINYGWDIMEGQHCFEPAQGCDQSGLEIPVAEYSRDQGCSITGGYVYRGQSQPALQGIYVFGDYCTGTIWGLAQQPDGQWEMRELLASSLRISSFGEDEAGEVYAVAMASGEIYHLRHEG